MQNKCVSSNPVLFTSTSEPRPEWLSQLNNETGGDSVITPDRGT